MIFKDYQLISCGASKKPCHHISSKQLSGMSKIYGGLCFFLMRSGMDFCEYTAWKPNKDSEKNKISELL